MRVPFKKPGHEVRMGSFFQSSWENRAIFKYTEGHPMRRYKDKKRALKQAKQATSK